MAREEEGWFEATVQFTNTDEETRWNFVAACTENGALGASEEPLLVSDSPDPSPACEACGTSTRCSIFFPESLGMEAVLSVLEERIRAFTQAAAPGAGARVVQCRLIGKEAWGTGWMQDFPPERVGKRLWTVPPWDKTPSSLPAGALSIIMEPGLAFGTGKHATTRHCLQFLEEVASEHVRLPGPFLDAGCGSAILSIAGALLGAEPVLAVEVDPDAIPTAKRNLGRNGLSGRVRLLNGPLECCRGRFELIAANLTAPVLAGYAGLLASRLAPGGLCIVSGILCGEKAVILDVFATHRLHALREKRDEEEGWTTLLLKKEPGP